MVWMVLVSSFKIFVQCAIKASLSAGSFLVKAAIQLASGSNCWSKKMGRSLIATSRRTMLEVFSIWLPSRLFSLLCRGFCCQFGSIPSLLEYTTSWQVGRKPQEWYWWRSRFSRLAFNEFKLRVSVVFDFATSTTFGECRLLAIWTRTFFVRQSVVCLGGKK